MPSEHGEREVGALSDRPHLPQMFDQAAKGKPFIIAKAGKPLVKVVPLEEPASRSRIGFLDGQFEVPDDFDEMGREEIEEMFYGKE